MGKFSSTTINRHRTSRVQYFRSNYHIPCDESQEPLLLGACTTPPTCQHAGTVGVGFGGGETGKLLLLRPSATVTSYRMLP
jgi:hypothetical protein